MFNLTSHVIVVPLSSFKSTIINFGNTQGRHGGPLETCKVRRVTNLTHCTRGVDALDHHNGELYKGSQGGRRQGQTLTPGQLCEPYSVLLR